MQIFATIASGATRVLDVCPTQTVQELKAKITAADGVPREEQRLTFAGQNPCDARTLADCGIAKESTVHVGFALRGGGNGCSGGHTLTAPRGAVLVDKAAAAGKAGPHRPPPATKKKKKKHAKHVGEPAGSTVGEAHGGAGLQATVESAVDEESSGQHSEAREGDEGEGGAAAQAKVAEDDNDGQKGEEKKYVPCVLCQAEGCETQKEWQDACCNCMADGRCSRGICGICTRRNATPKVALVANRKTWEKKLGRHFNTAVEWPGSVKFERKNTGGGQEPMQFEGEVNKKKRNCIISFPGSDEGVVKNKRCADLWNTMCLESHAVNITKVAFDKIFAYGVTTCCVFSSYYKGGHGVEHDFKDFRGECVCAEILEYVDKGDDKSGGMKQVVGCAWFYAWKVRLDEAIAAKQTLFLVTRDDGTIGKSQAGEKKYADQNGIRYRTITLAEYAKAMGVAEG